MSAELVAIIKTYPWQCMECKTCIICGQPHHEEEMMFCDVCDRGYHTFCVGLGAIPSGNYNNYTCSEAELKFKIWIAFFLLKRLYIYYVK